jgi:transcriptional regulator with XRE-family HTH domain
LSQAQLAEKLGLTQNQISRYERETISPSFDTLKEMTTLFETTADYLLGLTDERSVTITRTLSRHEIDIIELLQTTDDATQQRIAATLRLWLTDE